MRKKVLGIAVIVVIIFVGVYISDKGKSFTNKTINYNGTDLLVSIDGKDSDTLPSSGTYYLSSYKCSSSKTKVIWNKNNYTLSVSNGTSKGGVACNLEFSSKMLLSRVKAGSYVKYTGNNGCSGNACLGYNANYVSDTDMGYCDIYDYKFTVNGWRVGYISDGTAYLVSAGSPECIATDADGNMDNSGSKTSTYLDSTNLYKHLDNLDSESLLYCNLDYAYGGVCDGTSSWAMDTDDYNNITGSTLSSCDDSSSNMSCGYTDSLIDNGGRYWYATRYNTSPDYVFFWSPSARCLRHATSAKSYGLRPVLRLQSSVYVTGGSGTYEDPYIISNS